MIKNYVTAIPFSDMTPPNGWPTALGFVFIGGRYVTKLALTRPAAKEGEATFNVSVSATLLGNDALIMYANGKRYYFHEAFGYVGETIHLGFIELKHDLMASGFTVDKFPELQDYLE
jgi:hypothetical protein